MIDREGNVAKEKDQLKLFLFTFRVSYYWITILIAFQGISTHKLTKKINEFNAENEMLKNTLQTVKAELFLELDEIVGYLRQVQLVLKYNEQM